MKPILALLFVCILVSCQKEEIPATPAVYSIQGNWINPVYIDTLVTYQKADKLIDNQYGISFQENNKLIERKNNGWCGTPPITTADYAGTWRSTDSTLNISVGFWGGTGNYTWKIMSVTNNKLVISIIKEEYLTGK
jgi:hypothetical protein